MVRINLIIANKIIQFIINFLYYKIIYYFIIFNIKIKFNSIIFIITLKHL
jgi:hypothetical protein